MRSIVTILRDLVLHLPLIFRLAVYEVKSKYQMHYLGIFWQFLSPAIQVFVYWFVFGVGLRSGAPVGDTPFLLYLLMGLIPWMFISPTITQGSNSIYQKVNLVSKMKFPVSILPSITIVSNSFNFLIMMILLFIVSLFYRIDFSISIIQLPYYLFCMYALLFSITILFATISALVRDFQLILQSSIRLFFFLTPIFWSVDNFSEQYRSFINLNPFAYIVTGIRNSFLSGEWFYEDWRLMFYFWSLTLFILFIGCVVHSNFKNKFVDYL
ncbi:ABC transporter permease [Gracilibacillus phocaeensis]|uniref:ABC transporter permease n=1 Tax=Gracilibacillus phocaeensis TaxID=2042304 RepID=UPI001031F2AB|nr:ABC transporter permease [Gracilibacillus phocaeensis]